MEYEENVKRHYKCGKPVKQFAEKCDKGYHHVWYRCDECGVEIHRVKSIFIKGVEEDDENGKK